MKPANHDVVASELARLGFQDLGRNVTVAEIAFDFDRVMIGTHANQGLCIICSAQSEASGAAARSISALARALDLSGSRLSITTLIVGSSASTDSELLQWSRVVRVHEAALTDPSATSLALKSLAKLSYTATHDQSGSDPLASVWDALEPADSSSEMLAALRAASGRSATNVEETYRQWIEKALGSPE